MKTSKYADIINLPHPISKKHPQMSMYDRAAQFSPFAALTGYEDSVNEVARLTEDRIELDEEEKKQLDEKMKIIENEIINNGFSKVKITYFVPDEFKEGGRYEVKNGNIRKINYIGKCLVFDDRDIININDITNIDF